MDAEGFHEDVPCPECGSVNTVTYRYVEGFTELECQACGYRSDAEELSDLTRYQGAVLERHAPWSDDPADCQPTTDQRTTDGSGQDLPPVPIRPLEA